MTVARQKQFLLQVASEEKASPRHVFLFMWSSLWLVLSVLKIPSRSFSSFPSPVKDVGASWVDDIFSIEDFLCVSFPFFPTGFL